MKEWRRSSSGPRTDDENTHTGPSEMLGCWLDLCSQSPSPSPSPSGLDPGIGGRTREGIA
jgi:hypothetical protein